MALLNYPLASLPAEPLSNRHFKFLADQMQFDIDQGINTLTGHAVITNNVLTIKGDIIKIETQNRAIFRVSGTGNPIQLQRWTNPGTRVMGHSDKLVYDTRKWTLEFLGNAVITRPGWQMSGHIIEYNIRTGAIRSRGKSNRRVSITYQPSL